MTVHESPSVIIIGAGIAGLSAGVYAQANGFKTRIYEMHSKPGGLVTAWKRKGYIIDGCIHWLVGSRPGTAYHRLWEEIGLIQGRDFFNPEVFYRIEGPDGKALNLYCDADRLEAHLLELAPEDEAAIREMCRTVRAFARFDPPAGADSGIAGLMSLIRALPGMLPALPKFGRLAAMPSSEYVNRFKNDFLRYALNELEMRDMSAVVLLMALGWLHARQAGYPIGGSLPMARAVAKRFCDLGGEIIYETRVEEILVEDARVAGGDARAVGIRLADGREERADYVISAADGFNTIFKMLGGKYANDKFKALYETGEIFQPLLYIGLGINRRLDDPELYGLTGGLIMPIDEPFEVAGEQVNDMAVHIYNYDPTLAPPDKTVMTIMRTTSYAYWKELSAEPERYEAEKQRVAMEYIRRLDLRFPGLADAVEMADVATPVTFERYTGNWQGSFEGWLPTPGQIRMTIPKTLTGLANFYMAGQWVQPGGGLPGGVTTGRQVVQMMCRHARRKFAM